METPVPTNVVNQYHGSTYDSKLLLQMFIWMMVSEAGVALEFLRFCDFYLYNLQTTFFNPFSLHDLLICLAWRN